MISFRLGELARRCAGQLSGPDLCVERVSTDSRECAGALFVPLRGERHDGHDFIGDALGRGAAAVLTQRPLPPAAVPQLQVADTLHALGCCGQLVRERCPARLCSITGSCGKTTVKEMTAAICRRRGRTICTQGNFNNDVGVPLTLLRLEADTQYAVIEQGASHLQDLERTCRFVASRLGLITNAGLAHIEGFGSRRNVYRGKSELLDAVLATPDGVGIVSADSEYFGDWRRDYAAWEEQGRLLSFGRSPQATVQVQDLTQQGAQLSFTLSCGAQRTRVCLQALGVHNAVNAAAAAALALQLGLDLDEVRAGLESWQAMEGRLSVVRSTPFTLIDDAYNASFNAVMSAIDTLAGLPGYRVLIFADMQELGDEAEAAHAEVGRHAAASLDEMLCYGELAALSARAAGPRARHFQKLTDLIQYARHELLAQHSHNLTILVKGSHAMGLRQVVESLI